MKKRSTPTLSQRRQEYKDFRFRRRYDHFLRFRLKGAEPQEIINIAKELGFNLTMKDFKKKKHKLILPAEKTTTFDRLKHIFKFNS